MEFLTIGRNEIDGESFTPVADWHNEWNKERNKPSGGMWFTNHKRKYIGYNDWMDYLLEHGSLFYFKYDNLRKKNRIPQNETINDDPYSFVWPCAVINLKEDANIFTLDSKEKYDYLMKAFPSNNQIFSYEAMANIYDGIYIDYVGLELSDDDNLKYIAREFSVSTLLLFNLECIKEYYSGTITVYGYPYQYTEETCYEIKMNYDEPKVIKNSAKTRKRIK